MKKMLFLILVICCMDAVAQQPSNELQKLEIKKKKLEIKKLELEIKEQKISLWHERTKWSKTYLDRSKFFLSFGMGGSIPLQNATNSLMSSLVIRNKGMYVQFLSATLFLHKNWGVELNFKVNPGTYNDPYDTTYGSNTPFAKHIQALYGDRYYVSTTQLSWYAQSNVSLMAGPVYKIIKGRFMFMPKILFGLNTFGFDEGYAALKEKNSNEFVDKSYLPASNNKTAFAISPGFTASFRIAKKWAVNIDASYYRSAVSNTYTEQTFSYATMIKTTSTISESIVTQWVNVGAGVSLLLK